MPDDNIISSIRDNKHIPVLDGLRGFAVLYVMAYHYFHAPANYSSFLPLNIFYWFTSFGFSGVDLFFVLSGFLITGILIRNKEKKNYFRNFYIRRVLRIFPLYYFLLIVFIVIAPSDYLWMTEGNRYPYWLFIMNFKWCNVALHPFLVVAWSLSIEEQYYLVMPSIVYSLNENRLFILLMVVFIISFLMRTILFYSAVLDAETLYQFTLTHLDGLAIGGIIRLLFEYENKSKGLRLFFVKILPFITLVNIGIVTLCLLNPDIKGPLYYHPLMITFGFACISLMYGSLLMNCLYKNNFIANLFSTSFMRFNGKYSYALYLFHFIGLWIANNLLRKAFDLTDVFFLRNHLLLTVFAILVTYILAISSWHFLENPLLKVKRKYAVD